MERHEIIEFGTLNGVNYVNGRKDKFHVIYFDVTTYKDGKIYNNSDKFITTMFDEKGKFPYPYKYLVTAYNVKLNMIRNELMIVGELI